MNRFVKGSLLALGMATLAAPSAQAQSGGALLFNEAEADQVTVPGITADGTLRTIEAWVFHIGPFSSIYNTIIEFGNDAPFFGVLDDGQLDLYPIISGGTVPVGVWTHVAYTYDGTTSRLFIDGTMVASDVSAPPSGGVGMGIGYNAFDTPWDGYIDEVRLSNFARYTAAFAAPTGPFTVDANTIGLYHFDEPAGQTVIDAAGNNDGVLGSTAAVEANDPTRALVDAPLPVELSRFVGSPTTAGVELSWTTATERDNVGFTVLRDGVEIASYTGTTALRGHGTSSQPNAYAFVDARVRSGGRYTYQLRSIDLSGAQHDYPMTVTVEVQAPVEAPTASYALLGASPNPFNPTTEIRFTLPAAEPATLAVYDGLGRLIRSATVAGTAGLNRYTFDAAGLPSGMYTYRLRAGSFADVGRMTLVR